MDKDSAFARLSQTIEYLNSKGMAITDKEVAELSGLQRPHVTAMRNGDFVRITTGNLSKIAKAYSDYINEDWLLTGEGKMEKTDPNTSRPHIPSDKAVVSAGFEGKAIGSVPEGECELRPVMTPFPWYDFTIDVDGDSMEPELRDGDTIACAWLGTSADLLPDKIYVVDSAEGAVVKQLSSNGKELVCHSINPLYEDFTIRAENVVRIARVVGLVRNL